MNQAQFFAAVLASAPSVATSYSLTVSPNPVTAGSPATVTCAPIGGVWPSSGTLTLGGSGVAGSFGSTTLNPSGGATASVSTTWTASSGSGTETISVSNSMGLANPSSVALTVNAAAPAYPALALSSPTFATGRWGQALSGGTGTATLTVPQAARSFGFWQKADAGNPYCTILQVVGFASFGFSNGSPELSTDGGNAVLGGSPPKSDFTDHICDGAWHWFYVTKDQYNIYCKIDGASTIGGGFSGQSDSLTVNVGPTTNCAGGLIDDFAFWTTNDIARATPPTGPLTRTADTVVIWPLDGNGTGI